MGVGLDLQNNESVYLFIPLKSVVVFGITQSRYSSILPLLF